MRYTPRYVMTDPAEVKRLVRAHPGAGVITCMAAGAGLTAHPPATWRRRCPGGTSRNAGRSEYIGQCPLSRTSCLSLLPPAVAGRTGVRLCWP